MNPLTRALLLSWDLRPEILVPLILMGAFHFFGWRRLRRRSDGRFANRWRLASYTAGILILALALFSPIDVLSGQLFSIHMVQHLLLMMVCAAAPSPGKPVPHLSVDLARQPAHTCRRRLSPPYSLVGR